MSASLDQPPKDNDKMRSIEGARMIAALMVVLMHAASLMRVEHFSGHVGLGRIFDFGYVGVDFFFVLSGFIITYVHYAEIGQRDRMPRYLWRRFTRIYPIYWVLLLFVMALTTLGKIALGKEVGDLLGFSDLAGTVLLLPSTGEPKYIGVAWSLQFEVMFYCMFCLFFLSRRAGILVFSAWGGFVLAKVFGLTSQELPLFLGSAHCLQFLFGVVVGASARYYSPRMHSLSALAIALAIFAAVVLFEVYGPLGRHSSIGRLLLGLASAWVLAVLVALENTRSVTTPRWMARMGAVSYSIYLGHIAFINLAYAVLLKLGVYHALPEALVFLIAVSVALFVTCLVGFYIELPLVHKLKDCWRSKEPIAPAPAFERNS
jgi:exopolysaccharide production protein ExoZ